MELPASSEDDRRLRASAAADDDLLTRLVLRPFSRRLTKALEPTGRPSTAVIRLGLALGIAAALLAMPGNAVTSIASGIALLASSVAMLSAGEVVRYRRRPDFTGARWHRLASRVVEGAFVLGLGIGAARAGEPQWLLATAAVGLLVVMGNAIAGRAMVTGNTASDHRSLRWSAIAIALIVAGPGWALLAAALGALVILGLLAMRARADESTPDVQVPPSARFLTPLGALVDAGLPVRVISGAVGDRYVPLAGRLLTAGVAFVAVAVAWSWSDQGWPLVVAALVWLVLSGLALGTAPAGTAAWATPAALRAVEVVMLMAAASTLPGSARFAAALVVFGLYLSTMEVADQWRYGRRLPAPWRSVVDLGFDGRILLLALGLALGSGAATAVIVVLSVVLLAATLGSAWAWRSALIRS